MRTDSFMSDGVMVMRDENGEPGKTRCFLRLTIGVQKGPDDTQLGVRIARGYKSGRADR